MTHLLNLNLTNQAAKLLNDSISIMNKNAKIFLVKMRQEKKYDEIVQVCDELSVKVVDESVCIMGRNYLKGLLLTEATCALLLKVF